MAKDRRSRSIGWSRKCSDKATACDVAFASPRRRMSSRSCSLTMTAITEARASWPAGRRSPRQRLARDQAGRRPGDKENARPVVVVVGRPLHIVCVMSGPSLQQRVSSSFAWRGSAWAALLAMVSIGATRASACPDCAPGRAARAQVWADEFLANLAFTLAPFVVLVVVTMLISRSGLPDEPRRQHTP